MKHYTFYDPQPEEPKGLSFMTELFTYYRNGISALKQSGGGEVASLPLDKLDKKISRLERQRNSILLKLSRCLTKMLGLLECSWSAMVSRTPAKIDYPTLTFPKEKQSGQFLDGTLDGLIFH